MDRLWRRTGAVTSRRSALVLILAGALTVILATGLLRLDFATGQDSYLDADDPAAVANERYQELFGGEAMVVLLAMDEGRSVTDLFTPSNLARLEELEGRLRPADEVFAVVSPRTALQWSHDLAVGGTGLEIQARATARETTPAATAARERDRDLSFARAAQAGEPSLENPAWVAFLLYDNEGFELAADGQMQSPPDDALVIRPSLRSAFPDREHALLVVFLTGNASLDEMTAGVEVVTAALEGVAFDGASALIAGTPTFLTDLNDYLQEGLLILGLIALGVMLVVLALSFRVRWRLLPLAVVVVGIVWGFGAFGHLGLDLSLVTIAGLPILIGIGVDFAIQVHSRVEEEIALDRDPQPFAETMQRLGPPMLVATVAAALAFATMQLSLVPMMRDFGLLLAVGIVAMLAAGAILPLAVLGGRERRRPTRGFRPSRMESAAVWLGSAPVVVVAPLVVLALVLPLVGLALESRAAIESDPINWADQSSESVRNARALEDRTGYATTLGLFIRTGDEPVFSDELAAFTHDFARAELSRHPQLVAASSLFTAVSSLVDVPGASPLPPLGEDLRAAYEVAPPDISRLLVAEDHTAAQITFWVGPSSLDERAGLIHELEAAVARPADGAAPLPAGTTAEPSGLARIGVGLLENITVNRQALWATALLAVTGWLLLRLGSLGRAVLALLPVVLAIGAASTLVAVLGITLSPLTTISGPLLIAITAEFSVLILSRYLEERDRDLAPLEASRMAARRTGRAFMASALTTVGGFGVLLFAALPLLRDFGAVVTVNVAVALLAALVMVPPVAVWADQRGLLHGPSGRAARTQRRVAIGMGVAFMVAALAVAVLVADDSAPAAAEPTAPAPAGASMPGDGGS